MVKLYPEILNSRHPTGRPSQMSFMCLLYIICYILYCTYVLDFPDMTNIKTPHFVVHDYLYIEREVKRLILCQATTDNDENNDKNDLVPFFFRFFFSRNIAFELPNLCDWCLKIYSRHKLMT